MDELNLGEKLQQYRAMRHMTMRDLSSVTGITPSMLSQIERGVTNPSISTLRTIAKALDLPLYYFFFEDEALRPNFVVRSNERKTIGLPNYDVSYDLLTPDTSGELEFCMMRLQPGSHSSEKAMNHSGEEVSFVLQGDVRLEIEQECYALSEGDSVYIPPQANHRWTNSGQQEAVIIFAVTPPSF